MPQMSCSEFRLRLKARRSPQGMDPPFQGLQRCIGVQAELPSGELRSGQPKCCVRSN